MKKILLVVLLTCYTFLFIPTINVQASFTYDWATKETEFYKSVRHTELIGMINYNGVETQQKVNYLGGNIFNNDDLHIITGDNFRDFGWGKGTILTMTDRINENFPNYTVIGGVNGDFYNVNVGYPVEAYVNNFEVISMGLGSNRTVIGFKDNGEVVFGRPDWQGYELIVYDKDGNIKNTLGIDGINRMPSNETELTAFFDNFVGTIPAEYQKMIITATDIKIDDSAVTYFGKGHPNFETAEAYEMALQRIVIVGNNFNSDNFIEDTDTLVVQQHMGGEFEGVRFAIGAWETLVTDGVAAESFPSEHSIYRHPRTAIGVKDDGTVFFVTVDGRDYINNFLGVTNFELAEIMVYFDAVEAYNLDGGGSTTMSWWNEETETYDIMNTPSDGYVRPVSNGLFFVVGLHEPAPVQLPYPDTRTILSAPGNLQIAYDGLITFDSVEHATGYELYIDDELYILDNPWFQATLEPGMHTFWVIAQGDYTDFKDSLGSEPVNYTIMPERTRAILDLFNPLQ